MLTQLITETLLGALTGYVTNDTAIRSLFKPDGVIEKTRDDFAREAGRLLESQVLTPAVLEHQLMLPEVQDELSQALFTFLHKELPEAFDSLTLQDLPECDNMVQYVQQILLRFAASEREVLLHDLKKYFLIEDVLTQAQCVKLADTLEQLLLDTFVQEHFAERIWQNWMNDKGSFTPENLELASLCRTIAGNLAQYSSNWTAELVLQYGDAMKTAALESVRQLHLEAVLLEMDKQMEGYTLRQYLNGTTEELTDALNRLLHSAQGAQLIDCAVSEVLRALESVDTPIQNLIPSELLDDAVPLLQQELPAILETVLDWVWQNKQSVQHMLEETVDEIAAEAGGMKGMILQQLKDTLLGELLQFSDTYRLLLDVLSNDDVTDYTIDHLMHKLTVLLTENTVGQLVAQLNQNGRLQLMVRQFIYENLERYLNHADPQYLEQLLERKPGSLHLVQHKEQVEQILVQGLLFAAERLDISNMIEKGGETLVDKPISQLLPIGTAAFTSYLQRLVHDACAYAAGTLPQIEADTVYGALYDTLVWWLEHHGKAAMTDACAQVSVASLIQLTVQQLDGHSEQLIEFVSKTGLQVIQGKLSVLAEEQIQSLSSAEMLELVEDFMGRELQPLNYLGAGMGAAAGATVGMALSTAIPAISMANPDLAASVLAGKAAVFGAVGYTTNCAAVKGLFWPYEPVAGIRTIQGVVPKQKERFAGSMGRLVDRYVINDEILQQQIVLLKQDLQEQHVVEALASNEQLFARLFAELAMERRRIAEPVCETLIAYGSSMHKEEVAALGEEALSFLKNVIPIKTEDELLQVYHLLSVWLTDMLQKDIPLDALIDAETLWNVVETFVPDITLPDFSGMVQNLLNSGHTPETLLGEQYSSIKDVLQYYLTSYITQQKGQAQLAAGIAEILDSEKLYRWLSDNGDLWVKDNITMLFHWVESIILELVQSRQEKLAAAVEQELLNRMGLMMQMGYSMMNGGAIVAAIVDRLVNQKLPIFLSVKRKELEMLLGDIWEQRLSPAVMHLASKYLLADTTAFTHTALRTLLAQPTLQHCVVNISMYGLQIAAESPINCWGNYLNVNDLLARPQMQLGFQWKTHSKEILACWQQPMQSFCADKLHSLTLAKLCDGYHETLPIVQIFDGRGLNDTILALVTALEDTLSMTTLNDWLHWDALCATLTDDLAALLAQEHVQDWLYHEAELLVLALAEKPEQMLPASCRTVLLDKATAALFATAGDHGTALLGKMQLSALAEAQLKQMDSAHLELVVRGFAEHYLVHIQNRGWLGAVFALPGMLLYLF